MNVGWGEKKPRGEAGDLSQSRNIGKTGNRADPGKPVGEQETSKRESISQ